MADLIGKLVLAAADQPTFQAGYNTFCVATPLMLLEDSRRVVGRHDLFPNRGRIWWMLRSEHEGRDIRPGTLLSVRLETAEQPPGSDPDKDFYQVSRKDYQFGVRSYLEVLRLKTDPDPMRVLNQSDMTWPHEPMSRVVLAGPRYVLGPLSATWEPETRVTTFKAVHAGSPWMWRMPRNLVPEGALHEFTFTANQWNRADERIDVEVALLSERVLDAFQEKGERFEAFDDAQVIKWGLGVLGLSRSEMKRVRDVLQALPNIGTIESQDQRMGRFREIAASAERVLALNEEIGVMLADQSAFEDLVERHIQSATEDRVALEVSSRSGEIERKTAEARARLDRLKDEVERLDEEYQRRAQEMQSELEREREQLIQNLEEREKRVAAEEEALERRQEQIERNLQAVAERYREDAEGIIEDLLVQLPLLSRLGLSFGDRPSRPGGGEPRAVPLSPPAFLDRDCKAGGLTEEEFIDQLAAVVRSRGFVFDRDDLVNFHISVKTGDWTVLAGPSGTGKSSLPRLYAEALGCSDEMLFISVRPDWLDDRDVLGGFNALSGRFEPSSSGLVDRFIAAAEDRRRGRGGFYLVCLDEMNLARVEHYFAHFLSVMELPRESRAIELFARGLGHPSDPYAAWRRLPIPPNVRFVGTVNVDETTHFFSPKVIDRASLLVLRESDIAASAEARAEGAPAGGLAPVHADEVSGWVRSSKEAREGAREVLFEVNEVLKEHRVGLTHRPVHRFLGYVASAEGLLSSERALDLALSQIVVPRLRVTAPRYDEMLGRLSDMLPDSRYERTAGILARLIEAKGEYDFFQLL